MFPVLSKNNNKKKRRRHDNDIDDNNNNKAAAPPHRYHHQQRRQLVFMISFLLNVCFMFRETVRQMSIMGDYMACISNTKSSSSSSSSSLLSSNSTTTRGFSDQNDDGTMTRTRTTTMVPFRNKTVDGMSVLVYITTHLDDNQVFYFNHCWPAMIRHSTLLRDSDVLIYATPDNTSTEQIEAYKSMVSTYIYPNHLRRSSSSLKWIIQPNPGHHAGAIQAMMDGYRYEYFAGYDWIIRLNADVLIQNETWIRNMMHDSRIEGIFASCRNFACKQDHHCTSRSVMTDFTIWRPHALQHPSMWVKSTKSSSTKLDGHDNNHTTTTTTTSHYLLPFQRWNKSIAEASSKREFKATIIGRGTDRWIPDSTPVNGQCRISSGRTPFDKRNTREEGLPLYVVHNHDAGKCPNIIWKREDEEQEGRG